MSSKLCSHPMNLSIPSFSAATLVLMVACTRSSAVACADGLTRRDWRAGYLRCKCSTACSQVKAPPQRGMREPEAAGLRARTWASATSARGISVDLSKKERKGEETKKDGQGESG